MLDENNLQGSTQKNWTLFILVIVLVLFMSSCSSGGVKTNSESVASPNITLKASGSGSTSAVLTAIAPKFEAATRSAAWNRHWRRGDRSRGRRIGCSCHGPSSER